MLRSVNPAPMCSSLFAFLPHHRHVLLHHLRRHSFHTFGHHRFLFFRRVRGHHFPVHSHIVFMSIIGICAPVGAMPVILVGGAGR